MLHVSHLTLRYTCPVRTWTWLSVKQAITGRPAPAAHTNTPLAVRVIFSGKLSLKSTRAAAERRSLNAQIIHLLWQAFVVDAEVNASNSPKLRRRLV